MIRRVGIWFIIAVGCSCSLKAQQKKGVGFANLTQLGLATGRLDQALQVQMINGLRSRTWFAGLGAGLDNYYIPSFPLFADLRKHFGKGRQTAFLYTDLGTSFPVKRKTADNGETRTDQGGWFWEAGLGYSLPVSRRLSIVLSGGYSQKSMVRETIQKVIVIDFPPYDRDGQQDIYHYRFSRLSLKMGLQF